MNERGTILPPFQFLLCYSALLIDVLQASGESRHWSMQQALWTTPACGQLILSHSTAILSHGCHHARCTMIQCMHSAMTTSWYDRLKCGSGSLQRWEFMSVGRDCSTRRPREKWTAAQSRCSCIGRGWTSPLALAETIPIDGAELLKVLIDEPLRFLTRLRSDSVPSGSSWQEEDTGGLSRLGAATSGVFWERNSSGFRDSVRQLCSNQHSQWIVHAVTVHGISHCFRHYPFPEAASVPHRVQFTLKDPWGQSSTSRTLSSYCGICLTHSSYSLLSPTQEIQGASISDPKSQGSMIAKLG